MAQYSPNSNSYNMVASQSVQYDTSDGEFPPYDASSQQNHGPYDDNGYPLNTPLQFPTQPSLSPAASYSLSHTGDVQPTRGVEIVFDQLSFAKYLPSTRGQKVSTFDSLKSLAGMGPPPDVIFRLNNISGVIPAGRMVLVLGASSSGKTSLLKSMVSRLESETSEDRRHRPTLLYNGHTLKEYNKIFNCRLQDQLQYASQLDQHLNYLTVEETFEFACRTAFPTTEQRKTMSEYDIELFIKDRVNSIIRMLDLHHCRHTILGDHNVHGVSGGEAKRVTIGEMLIPNPQVIALDQYTDGLDIRVAQDITQSLRAWCKTNSSTVIATVQQPDDAIFNMYDDLILLREGHIIYQGPCNQVLSYVENVLKFTCPDDIAICDFLLDVISNPYITARNMSLRTAVLQDDNSQDFAIDDDEDDANNGYYQQDTPLNHHHRRQLHHYDDDGIHSEPELSHNNGPNGEVFSSSHFLSSTPLPNAFTSNIKNISSGHLPNNSSNDYDAHVPVQNQICDLEETVSAYHNSFTFYKQRNCVDWVINQRQNLHTIVTTAPSTADISSRHLVVSVPNEMWNRPPPIQPRVLTGVNQTTPPPVPFPDASISQNAVISAPSISSSIINNMPVIPFPPYLHASFRLVLSRQVRLMKRNTFLVRFRLINAIIASLLLSFIFFRLPTSMDYIFQRTSVLCIMFGQFGILNLTTILTFTRYSNVVKKQISSGMYPSTFYSLSLFLASLPQLCVEACIVSVLLYVITGFTPSISRFILFTIVASATAINNSALLQILSAATSSESLAEAMAAPVTGILWAFSGLFVAKHQLPVPMQYVMFATPYAQGVRALLNLEFLSPRYDQLTIDGTRMGHAALRQLDIDIGYEYIWYCLLYMLIASTIFLGIHMFILNVKHYSDHIGTQRFSTSLEDIIDNQLDITEENSVTKSRPGSGSNPSSGMAPINEEITEIVDNLRQGIKETANKAKNVAKQAGDVISRRVNPDASSHFQSLDDDNDSTANATPRSSNTNSDLQLDIDSPSAFSTHLSENPYNRHSNIYDEQTATYNASIQQHQHHHQQQHQHHHQQQQKQQQAQDESIFPIMSAALAFTPCTLAFSDLCYTIQLDKQAQVAHAVHSQHDAINNTNNNNTNQLTLQSQTAPPAAVAYDPLGTSSNNDAEYGYTQAAITAAAANNGGSSASIIQPHEKRILHSINGYAQPGKLTALMGPSGGGKSTLLDIISQRKSAGKIIGSITVNGNQMVDPVKHKVTTKIIDLSNIIGYVEQADWLYKYETVEEALMFVAEMKLPLDVHDIYNASRQKMLKASNNPLDDNMSLPMSTYSALPEVQSREEVKKLLVEEILHMLELTSVRHHFIGSNGNGSRVSGGDLSYGLSLSQCKRLSIGLELIANPAVLYLDEPTTGLSATEAFVVMRICHHIAKCGRTVICTVHSPSAEMFYLFDNLILLGAGGHQIYCGPVGNHGKTFIKYYQTLPIVTKLPLHVNPATWMLEQLTPPPPIIQQSIQPSDSEHSDQPPQLYPSPSVASTADSYITYDDLEQQDKNTAQRIGQFNALWLQSLLYANTRRIVQTCHDTKTPVKVHQSIGYGKNNTPHTPSSQLWLLFQRFLGGQLCDVDNTHVRLVIILIVTFIASGLYHDLNVTSESGVTSAISSKCMGILFSALLFSVPQLRFVQERPCYQREEDRGYYQRGGLWIIACYFVDVLYCVFAAIFCVAPGFFLLNPHLIHVESHQEAFIAFIRFTFCSFLCFFFVTAFSFLLVSFCHNPRLVGVIQSLGITFLLYLNGVIVPQHRLTTSVGRFIQRLMPTRFLSMALTIGQMKPYRDVQIELINDDGSITYMSVLQYVYNFFAVHQDPFWYSVVYVLFVCSLFFVLMILFARYCTFKRR